MRLDPPDGRIRTISPSSGSVTHAPPAAPTVIAPGVPPNAATGIGFRPPVAIGPVAGSVAGPVDCCRAGVDAVDGVDVESPPPPPATSATTTPAATSSPTDASQAALGRDLGTLATSASGRSSTTVRSPASATLGA